jgi:hypothetical protein
MPFKQLAFPRFDLRRSITSNTFVVKGQQLFLEISNLAIKRYQAYHCRPVPNEDIPFTSLFFHRPVPSSIQNHSASFSHPSSSSIHPLLWPSGDLRSCRRFRHHQQLVERHGCQRGTVGAVVELLLLLLLVLMLLLSLLLSSSCHRVIVSRFATPPVVKAAAVSADCLDCVWFWMVFNGFQKV